MQSPFFPISASRYGHRRGIVRHLIRDFSLRSSNAMAKIDKAVARTSPPKAGKDLFSDLPEAAPRRLVGKGSAGKGARAGRRVSGVEPDYTAHDSDVLEGLRPVRRRPR